MSYVRLINQCGLYVDKIKIFLKISGCGLYTGALNRPKITVFFSVAVFLSTLLWEFLFVSAYLCVTAQVCMCFMLLCVLGE